MADFLDVITTYNIPAAYWVNLKLAFFSTVIALTLGLVLAMMRISPIPSLRALGRPT